MKDVYIVLTKSKSITSRIINFLMPTEYTHSSIAFDKELNEMYSIGRRYAFLFFPAHLKKENLESGFYHYYDLTKIGVYSIEVSQESYIAMKEYVDKLYQNNTKLKYSSWGLAFCRLHIGVVRKNKMFCSQFVCNVLMKAKEQLIDIPPELCTPTDFLKIKGIKCHYVGSVNELVKIQNNR